MVRKRRKKGIIDRYLNCIRCYTCNYNHLILPLIYDHRTLKTRLPAHSAISSTAMGGYAEIPGNLNFFLNFVGALLYLSTICVRALNVSLIFVSKLVNFISSMNKFGLRYFNFSVDGGIGNHKLAVP